MEVTFIHTLKSQLFFLSKEVFLLCYQIRERWKSKFAERKISVALREYELFGMILKQGKHLLRYFLIHVEFLVLSFESLLRVKCFSRQFKYVFNIEKVNKTYLIILTYD